MKGNYICNVEKIYKKLYKIKEKKTESKKEIKPQTQVGTYKADSENFFDSNKKNHKYDTEVTYTSNSELGYDRKRVVEDIEKLDTIFQKYISLFDENDRNEVTILVNNLKQL